LQSVGNRLIQIALGATLYGMASLAVSRERVFKTAWFSKAARKAHISDDELRSAMRKVMLGEADDLGGGVFKRRLDKNRSRSIVLAKGGRYWVYEYLYAKKDRDNIEDDELAEFRKLAKVYEKLTEQQVDRLLQNNAWMEIRDEC
jgi:hypothetical protein